MGSLILDALVAAAGDLAAGLAFVVLLALIAWLIRGESKAAREGDAPEPQAEYQDIWAGLRPEGKGRVAETDFESDRRAA